MRAASDEGERSEGVCHVLEGDDREWGCELSDDGPAYERLA